MHLFAVLIPLIAAFVGLIGSILAGVRFMRPGRIPRPLRMVNYRVHYDDSLGTRADVKRVAELVVRRHGQDVPDASLVMIRISNEGGLDIGKEHWVMPVNFTFDGRDVVGVEVSDARGAPAGDGEVTLFDGQAVRISKGRKALELPRIDLRRRGRIRLLVLLSGPREHLGPGVLGDAEIKGSVRGGGLVREVTPGRERFYTFGWAGFTVLSLVAAVLVALTVRPFSSGPPSYCVSGHLTVAGSTAFAPPVTAVANQFMSACQSSVVAVNPPGATSATVRATRLVMSDGKVPASGYPSLMAHSIAVVIFAIVVNRATGIHSLTAAQLADIWTGEYTEIGPSSTNCTSANLRPDLPVIRCEKKSTGALLQTVNSIEGAIGYAEAAEAARYPRIDVIQLNGADPTAAAVKSESNQYPFYAVEYLYTDGVPRRGSLLSAFLHYMFTDTAKSILQSPDWGDIPCSLTNLCSG